MTNRGVQVGLTAVAWVASALLAGWLMAPWFGGPANESLDPGVGTPATPAATSPTDARGIPALDPLATARAGDEGASGPSTPPGAAPHADRPATAPRLPVTNATPLVPVAPTGAIGHLLFTVRGPDGEPVEDCTVYALPAGAPGSDEEDSIYHAWTDENGQARLAVPAGAPLDCAVAVSGRRAMQRDVTVATGGTAEVELQLPAGVAISARCEFIAQIDARRRRNLLVMLQEVPGDDTRKGRAYAGRDERPSAGQMAARFDENGHAEVMGLAAGSRYRVDTQYIANQARALLGKEQEVYAEPPIVEAGGEVSLRVRMRSEVSVRLEVPEELKGTFWAVSAWLEPLEGGNNFQLFQTDTNRFAGAANGVVLPKLPDHIQEPQRTQLLERMRAQMRKRGQIWPVVQRPGAGKWRLQWAGTAIAPGPGTVLDLLPGQRTEIVVRLEPGSGGLRELGAPVDPNAEEPATPLLLSGRPLDPDGEAYIYVVRGTDEEAETYDFYADEPQVFLDAELRSSASPAIAVASGLLASPPFDLRTGAQLAITLRPGGLLMVVDSGAVAFQAAPVAELTRVDGAPIPYTWSVDDLDFNGDRRELTKDWVAYEAYPKVQARIGGVLGPFPEGTIQFRVVRGGFATATISAKVVAGLITPLIIPR